jgi:GNAT superfamily N-acetyltransferase
MARATSRPSRPRRQSPGSSGFQPPPSSSWTARPFVEADLEGLRRLRQQADVLHARLIPGFFRIPVDLSAPGLERDAASEILVAVGPAGLGGYVQVRLVETPQHPAMTPARRAHVEILVVDEGHRRQGLGTRLMAEADAWAKRRGAIELVLTVWTQNRAAAGFYRALGYGPVAQVLRKPVAAAGPTR